MLYGCGFRISELLNLKLSDVDTEKGLVHVLHAKNDNERFVPMAESLNQRCKTYILTAHKGHCPDYPFFFKRDGSKYTVSNIEKHFREMLWLRAYRTGARNTGREFMMSGTHLSVTG